MTESEIKNLKLARAAISKGDYKEAKLYYRSILLENPENLEAAWFYQFGLVTEDVNKETADNYRKLDTLFYPTLKYIATLEEGEEKQKLAYTMIMGFPALHDILFEAIVMKASAFDRRTDIQPEDAAKIGYVDKKLLAENILKIFGENEPYCFLAADIWKEMIAERFKWSPYRNFKDKGKELWFDELAKRIKKYDPTYELPKFKQQGCIGFGNDAAKVKPGD